MLWREDLPLVVGDLLALLLLCHREALHVDGALAVLLDLETLCACCDCRSLHSDF